MEIQLVLFLFRVAWPCVKILVSHLPYAISDRYFSFLMHKQIKIFALLVCVIAKEIFTTVRKIFKHEVAWGELNCWLNNGEKML